MTDPRATSFEPCLLELEAGTHWWCTCGLSGHQPLCDGSHKGSGMAPKKFVLEHHGKVLLCTCKSSGDTPFCDGTHRRLSTASS